MTLVLNLTKSLVDIKASENGSTSETQREVTKLFRPSKTHVEAELSILTGSMMLYWKGSWGIRRKEVDGEAKWQSEELDVNYWATEKLLPVGHLTDTLYLSVADFWSKVVEKFWTQLNFAIKLTSGQLLNSLSGF